MTLEIVLLQIATVNFVRSVAHLGNALLTFLT